MKIFSAGMNDRGQIGRTGNSTIADKIKIGKNEIISASSGGFHNILLLKNGKALIFGCNIDNQLGFNQKMIIPQPTMIDYKEFFPLDNDEYINFVSCGEVVTIFISNKGKVFRNLEPIAIPEFCVFAAVGKCINSSYIIAQSGALYRISDNEIERCLLNTPVYDVACGVSFQEEDFVVVITTSHVAMGCGKVVDHDTNEFFEIESLKKVRAKRVFAYSQHCIVLDMDGNVYAWGDNMFGQLGLGPDEVFYDQFHQIPFNTKIVDVSLGCHHTIFIDEKGKMYACGTPEDGRLLDKAIKKEQYTPKKILPFKMKNETPFAVSCGSFHTLIFTGNGKFTHPGLENILNNKGLRFIVPTNAVVKVLRKEVSESFHESDFYDFIRRKEKEEFRNRIHEENIRCKLSNQPIIQHEKDQEPIHNHQQEYQVSDYSISSYDYGYSTNSD